MDFELTLQWLEALEMEWDQCSLHIWRTWVLGIQRADNGRWYNDSQQCQGSNSLNIVMCWKRPWCWERLKAGGEANDREWDGWMASSTQWTWVWVNSRSWWWTVRPDVLQSMGLQRVRYDWMTELNSGIYYLLERRDFADVVKWTALSWRDYPGLFGWAQWLLRIKELFQAGVRGRCDYEEWSERYNVVGFEDRGRRLWAMECEPKDLQKIEKQGMPSYWYLAFNSVRPMSAL